RRLHQRRAPALPQRHLRRAHVDRGHLHDRPRPRRRPGVRPGATAHHLERTPYVTLHDETDAARRDGATPPRAPRTLIQLEGVGKIYPGTDAPAVADLHLEIPEGEILVLVGPSGCGKSTTLRLINRMIEPTSGRIIFDGDDVTDVNPDQLRRRI